LDILSNFSFENALIAMSIKRKKSINFIRILKVNLALHLIYFSKNIPKAC